MRCPNCKVRQSRRAEYCTACGAKLEKHPNVAVWLLLLLLIGGTWLLYEQREALLFWKELSLPQEVESSTEENSPEAKIEAEPVDYSRQLPADREVKYTSRSECKEGEIILVGEFRAEALENGEIRFHLDFRAVGEFTLSVFDHGDGAFYQENFSEADVQKGKIYFDMNKEELVRSARINLRFKGNDSDYYLGFNTVSFVEMAAQAEQYRVPQELPADRAVSYSGKSESVPVHAVTARALENGKIRFIIDFDAPLKTEASVFGVGFEDDFYAKDFPVSDVRAGQIYFDMSREELENFLVMEVHFYSSDLNYYLSFATKNFIDMAEQAERYEGRELDFNFQSNKMDRPKIVVRSLRVRNQGDGSWKFRLKYDSEAEHTLRIQGADRSTYHPSQTQDGEVEFVIREKSLRTEENITILFDLGGQYYYMTFRSADVLGQ